MKRILIIDDTDSVRASLKEMLESHNFEVLEAENGISGLKLFKENDVDLILTDLIMPEKDGLEVIRELKLEHPLTKIIAISGGITDFTNSANVLLPIAESLGARKILKKPYSPDELLETIKEVLEE